MIWGHRRKIPLHLLLPKTKRSLLLRFMCCCFLLLERPSGSSWAAAARSMLSGSEDPGSSSCSRTCAVTCVYTCVFPAIVDSRANRKKPSFLLLPAPCLGAGRKPGAMGSYNAGYNCTVSTHNKMQCVSKERHTRVPKS
eukprot:1159431-Pelagomonas_calceolata.AAC.7